MRVLCGAGSSTCASLHALFPARLLAFAVSQHGRVPLAPSAGLPAGAHTMYAIKTNSVEPTLTLGNPGPIDPKLVLSAIGTPVRAGSFGKAELHDRA